MKRQSLLWRISRKDGLRDSYVLGTIHVGADMAVAALPLYRRLIDECQVYAGESNLDALAEMQMPGKFSREYIHTYQSVLTPNQLKHLDRYIQKNIPQLEDIWPAMHPLLVLSQIEVSLIADSQMTSLDQQLWNYAKQQDKTVLAIEPAGMQMKIFEELDTEAAFASLKKTIRNLRGLRQKYKKLAKNYEEGDIRNLYKKAKKQLGKNRRLLLYDRNVFMTGRIEELTREHSTFIGIGVGHLPGYKGVLRLLKHRGYSVKPVGLRNEEMKK